MQRRVPLAAKAVRLCVLHAACRGPRMQRGKQHAQHNSDGDVVSHTDTACSAASVAHHDIEQQDTAALSALAAACNTAC